MRRRPSSGPTTNYLLAPVWLRTMWPTWLNETMQEEEDKEDLKPNPNQVREGNDQARQWIT